MTRHRSARIRRLACPTSTAALLLELATDTRAGLLSLCAPRRINPDLGQVGLLTGTYRIPAIAAPLLRAALLDHRGRGVGGDRSHCSRDRNGLGPYVVLVDPPPVGQCAA